MTANPSAKLILNSTQIPNILFEWMPKFTGNEFMVLMVIARQTYGWHKEREWIAYSQLILKTGLHRETIAIVLKSLKEKEIIEVTDKEGFILKGESLSGRRQLFYKIKFGKSDNIFKEKEKSENPTFKSRNFGHTKETNTKDKTLLLRNNGQAQGIKKIGDLIKNRPLTRTLPIPDNRISQGFQFYAYRAADIAGFKNGGRSRLFQIFKANNYGEFQVKKTAEVVKHPNFLKLPNEQAKAAYLAGAFRRSL